MINRALIKKSVDLYRSVIILYNNFHFNNILQYTIKFLVITVIITVIILIDIHSYTRIYHLNYFPKSKNIINFAGKSRIRNLIIIIKWKLIQ